MFLIKTKICPGSKNMLYQEGKYAIPGVLGNTYIAMQCKKEMEVQ